YNHYVQLPHIDLHPQFVGHSFVAHVALQLRKTTSLADHSSAVSFISRATGSAGLTACENLGRHNVGRRSTGETTCVLSLAALIAQPVSLRIRRSLAAQRTERIVHVPC